MHEAADEDYGLDRYLAERQSSYLQHFLPAGISLDNFEEIFESQFVYLGVAEDLQTSVDHLGTILGYPSIPVPVKNTSERSETEPEGAREEFARNNPLETAVYEYALAHYRA